jgi:hypothetical protein
MNEQQMQQVAKLAGTALGPPKTGSFSAPNHTPAPSRVEATIGRYKQVIGDGLRARWGQGCCAPFVDPFNTPTHEFGCASTR